MSRSAPFENRWVRAALATLLSAVTWLTPTPSRAAPEGQITWGVHISLAPTWFDPAETPGIITPFMIMYALHDAMVKPMPGIPLAPSLAESWTVSRDGLAYEFVLRKGARFHNGDPVTAEDVKFSLERYRGTSGDRKSTRLNSSHSQISYAVFCLKKKNRCAGHRQLIRVKVQQAVKDGCGGTERYQVSREQVNDHERRIRGPVPYLRDTIVALTAM